MRLGRREEAEVLAQRIGLEIIDSNTAQFRSAGVDTDAKTLWAKVKQLSSRGGREVVAYDVTADQLNAHYADISRDHSYVPPMRKASACQSMEPVTLWQVFYALDHLEHTATGLDGLPAWFLRLGSHVFAEPLTALFNLSITTSTVPTQWKRASILPIAKVPQPCQPSDFRPISITPVLTRILERFVVRQYIYPTLSIPPPPLQFNDQFAFRPSGSPAAAIIMLLQTVTTLLNTNPYVAVYALDFSKAFDTVRHSTLMEKFAMLNLPDCVYNWLVDFFNGHTHCTKFQGLTSQYAEINASVVQGSAVGPAAYLVNAADLRPAHKENALIKFADDTYLIVAAERIQTRDAELQNVATWAATNNLRLNQAKSIEIIFTKPGRERGVAKPPPSPDGIVRKESVEMLGVTFSSKFSTREHVSATLAACQQTLFALRTLRAHGLDHSSLQTVFTAVAIAKLRYASPAWYGFTSAEDRERIEVFLRKSKRAGYCPADALTFSSMCDSADDALFKSIVTDIEHVLHQLLPPRERRTYDLRPRPHDFVLPRRTSHLADSNFIIRMLFKK